MSINVESEAPLPLRQRLRQALVTAMKARDQVAVAALRSALAAIDNAEAITPEPSAAKAAAIETSPIGVGATEVSRQTLTEVEIAGIVRAEVAERHSAALDYEEASQPQRADLLRNQAKVLAAHLDGAA